MIIFAIFIQSRHHSNALESKDISLYGALALDQCKKFNETDFDIGIQHIDDFYFYLKKDSHYFYVFAFDFPINKTMIDLQFRDLATIAQTKSQADLNRKIIDPTHIPSKPPLDKKSKTKTSCCFCWFKTSDKNTHTQENDPLLKVNR